MPNDDHLPEIRFRPFLARDFARLLAAISSPQALMQWAGPTFRFPLDAPQPETCRAFGEGRQATRRILAACEEDGRCGTSG